MNREISRANRSLINRRAAHLARMSYEPYRYALMQWALQQQQAGNNLDADAINAAVPDITDLMRGQ